ncbi:hypothetical protein NFI96_029647 [Prochilodus magdalenae]|nr:hypothetical protein NFI96_029647 [Prochilodus magdalenae]
MKRNLLTILIITSGVFGADVIRPSDDQKTNVSRTEGEPLTLKCSYETSSQYVLLYWYDGGVQTLYWYRQYPGTRPEYLLTIVPGSDAVSLGRLKAEVDKDLNHVDLEISSTALPDSVLYYCALKPTVTGNPDTLYRNWFYNSCRAVLLSGGGAVYLSTFRPSCSSTNVDLI